MRIESSQVNSIQAPAPNSRRATEVAYAAGSGAGQAADSLRLSDTTGQVRRAQAAASAAPEIRAEKVASIKAQVQSGAYQVNTDVLAQKLLDVV